MAEAGTPPWSPTVIRVRRAVNVVNLATPVGLLVARIGRAEVVRGPHGLLLAKNYRARVPAPRAPAVTIGDVVLLRRDDAWIEQHPRMLDHEARHSFQYTFWLGPAGFLPAYLAASVVSWWRTGDFALGNAFERRAGLVDGNYVRGPDDPRLQQVRSRRPRRGRR